MFMIAYCVVIKFQIRPMSGRFQDWTYCRQTSNIRPVLLPGCKWDHSQIACQVSTCSDLHRYLLQWLSITLCETFPRAV